MISKSQQPRRCYVYMTLPGETKPVTAGRYELGPDRSGVPLGRFVYGRSYLARAEAVEIDPVELKLAPRLYETMLLNGVFGALRDAAPDYWGRLVIERALGKGPLGEMDYLLQSADDRAGALGFGLSVSDAGTPDSTAAFIHSEQERWRGLVTELGMEAQ